MKLSNYPLLKILLPYVLGIITAYYCPFFSDNYTLFFILSLIFLLISIPFLHLKSYNWQWVKTLTIFLGFVFAGMFAENFRISTRQTELQAQSMDRERCFLVRIVDFPRSRAKSMKVQAELLSSSAVVPMRGGVLLYLQKDSLSAQLCYGDILLIETHLEAFSPPANPDAFDNKKYMRRKGLSHVGYVHAGAWHKLDHVAPDPLKDLSHHLQKKLSKTFTMVGMTGRECDIVRAILLGDDDTMDPELRTTYAAAGVSHILCVSGMHVGVIFMIMNFLLRPMELFRFTKIVKALILLFVIWLYANITGLSPSVTRAAAMFTFVTTGSLLQRNTNVFHSILASLFILLIINPLLLFEVGFQLSYLAVYGIVLFQPLIAGLYRCKTKAGNYFWELMSVSVAAQISTFPISIFYFGQFPNYFILSNLSVIALSFVVMITGVVLLSLSFLPYIAQWVAILLTGEIRLMNAVVTFVEALPGSVTRDIDFSAVQVLLLYALIIILYMFFKYRRRLLAWGAYSIFALFSLSFAVRKVHLIRQAEMVVFNVRGVSALEFCQQQQCVLFTDSIFSDTCTSFVYALKNHARKIHASWLFLPVDTPFYKNDFLYKRGNFIQYYNMTLYLLRRGDKIYPMSHRPAVDRIVLQHNPTVSPEQVADALDFHTVVVDGTCTEYCKQRWRTYCRQQKLEMLE